MKREDLRKKATLLDNLEEYEKLLVRLEGDEKGNWWALTTAYTKDDPMHIPYDRRNSFVQWIKSEIEQIKSQIELEE